MTEEQVLFMLASFCIGAFGSVFGVYQYALRKDYEHEVNRLRELASYNAGRFKK